MQCVQEAGHGIFVPFAWPHSTLNLQTSIGFSQEIFNSETGPNNYLLVGRDETGSSDFHRVEVDKLSTL